MERLSPEQKIQRDFIKQASKLGMVVVRWYEETGEPPNIQTHLIWQDDGQVEGWSVKISQPHLGEVSVPIKELDI